MDYYLHTNNVYKRLENEYKEHGKLIIAVDFDDTLFDTHNKGRDYSDVISLLRKWQDHAVIIIWTASKEERYTEIEKYLKKRSIPYNGINCDVVECKSRKIYANAFLDDRAGLSTVVYCLSKLINKIKNGELVYDKAD